MASRAGPDVDMEIDQQGRSHIVYDAGQRGVLAYLWWAVRWDYFAQP